jgi:hypothetical protein
MSGACPMMAKAAASAACHASAPGGRKAPTAPTPLASLTTLLAPMDCCRPAAVPSPTPVLPGLEPSPVAVGATLPVATVAAGGEPRAFPSRSAALHSLGLFTLNSVWRI